jgi:hypothetical protein
MDRFTPGSVSGVSFDTGAFTGTATFAIPSSATSGTGSSGAGRNARRPGPWPFGY